MKKIILHSILLFCSFILQGQDINYYRIMADTTHDSLKKLVAIDSVLSKSFASNPDTFITYSLEYIALAKNIDSIAWAAKKAMNLQGPLLRKGEARKSITVLDGVLARKNKIKDSFLLGGLYLKKGGGYFVIDTQKAIENYTLAIENFSKEKDSIYIADAYLFRGQAYSNVGAYVPATNDFNTAYTYYEKLKDYEYMLHAQQGNIIMYSQNGFYKKAIAEREKLINKLLELKLNRYLPREYANQSLDYKKIGNKKMQLQSLLEAKRILLKGNHEDIDIEHFIEIYSKLVTFYAHDYNFVEAENYLNQLGKVKNQMGSDRMNKINYYNAFATYYFQTKEYDSAAFYAKKLLKNTKELNHSEATMEAYLLLSSILENSRDYKNSLYYKNAYLKINDSIRSSSATNALAYYQTLYETEKKEKELALKNANINLLKTKNSNLKKTGIFITSVVILLFGFGYLYSNKKNLEAKRKLQEKFSHELLLSQEKERKRISSDLHDSVGQRLLILKNKLLAFKDPSSLKMIEETIEEVRTISKNLYPFQLQELGITKAILQNISQIDENTNLFISSEIDNIDDILPKEKEVNLYRIVQESLNNIIKHAQAKAGKVTIKKTAEFIHITIKDNGVGFEFQKKIYENSMGLKTLLERTKYLNGQVLVFSKKGEGTQLDFKIPIS